MFFWLLWLSLGVQPCSTTSLLPSPNPHRASVSSRAKGPLKALNLKLHTDQTPPTRERRRRISSESTPVDGFGPKSAAGADGGARTAMASCDRIEMASGLEPRRSRGGRARLGAGRESPGSRPGRVRPVRLHISPGVPVERLLFFPFHPALRPLPSPPPTSLSPVR